MTPEELSQKLLRIWTSNSSPEAFQDELARLDLEIKIEILKSIQYLAGRGTV